MRVTPRAAAFPWILCLMARVFRFLDRPLHYFDFPKSVCTSVNEVVCHGIPDLRELQDGDIVNCDISAILNGYHTDLNETFIVGNSCSKEK